MAKYAVLVFREQPLTDQEQLCFTRHFGDLEQTRGGTRGNIHFRTDEEVRKLLPGIKDFSNIGPTPVSGRKSVFLSARAGEIEGMPSPQARMLFLDLTEFATRERVVYSHQWTGGDLAMWDPCTAGGGLTRTKRALSGVRGWQETGQIAQDA